MIIDQLSSPSSPHHLIVAQDLPSTGSSILGMGASS
jgi:hypothetical protein